MREFLAASELEQYTAMTLIDSREILRETDCEGMFEALRHLAPPPLSPIYAKIAMSDKQIILDSLGVAIRNARDRSNPECQPRAHRDNALGIALAEAREVGLLPSRTPADLGRRLPLALELARTLVANPTKVVALSALPKIAKEGITSNLVRGNLSVMDFVAGDTNAVHTSCGMPYVYLKGLSRAETNKCLLVLDGRALVSRADCSILTRDSGIIVRDHNPLSGWISHMNRAFPELRKSQLDFLSIAWQEMRRHPAVLTQAIRMAKDALEARQLRPRELFVFLEEVLAQSFPFPNCSGGRRDDLWHKPYLPELKVEGRIPPQQIKAAIYLTSGFSGKNPKFGIDTIEIPAPSSANGREKGDLLLQAYANYIGKPDLFFGKGSSSV